MTPLDYTTAVTLVLFSCVAFAGNADPSGAPSPGILPVPDYSGNLATRDYLTGAWGGTRRNWADKGAAIRFDWYQASQGVVDGGIDEKWKNGTNLDLYVDLDLDRMGLLPGAVVSLRAQSRFGDAVNGISGLLLPVNTYSAFPLTDPPDKDVDIALTEFNYTQFFSEHFALMTGKITTMGGSNEFAGGEGRSQFMNFQFLFPAVYAQLAPYSTLAAGALWLPSTDVTVTSILMNTTDASTTSGFGDIGDGTTWWNSIQYQWALNGKPGGTTAGFLYAWDGDYATVGGINFDPGLGEIAVDRKSTAWALRFDGWQYLSTEPGSGSRVDPTDGEQDLQGVGVFASLGFGDGKTNPVDWALSLGLGARGLIPGRDRDTLGFGYFYNALKNPDTVLSSLLTSSTRGIEMYYNYSILPSVDLTFDFQWTDAAVDSVDDGYVLGVRLNVSF